MKFVIWHLEYSYRRLRNSFVFVWSIIQSSGSLTRSSALPLKRPATGVRPKRATLHDHRRQTLDHFRRYAGDAAGEADGVQAVFGRPRACAADLKQGQSE